MTPEEMEQLLRKDAAELVKTEPLSKLMLEEQVLNRKNFADMLCVTLACQLAGEVIDRAELEKMFSDIYKKYPNLLL
jgi:serine O-acetyltransferase